MFLFKKKPKPEKKNYKTESNKLAYAASQQTYELDNYNNKYHKHLEDSGYVLDKELSKDFRHKVYHNPNKKHTIIGYKGTTNGGDVLADLDGIGLDNYDHPEFTKAYSVYDKVKERYGDRILTTGHSLGGTKAIKSAEKNNGESIVFNPGSSPLVSLDTNEKSKTYRHSNDQVSAYVRGNVENVPLKKKATYGFGSSNPLLYGLDQLDSHTLDGFDDEFFF
jgi:hypothetical protein